MDLADLPLRTGDGEGHLLVAVSELDDHESTTAAHAQDTVRRVGSVWPWRFKRVVGILTPSDAEPRHIQSPACRVGLAGESQVRVGNGAQVPRRSMQCTSGGHHRVRKTSSDRLPIHEAEPRPTNSRVTRPSALPMRSGRAGRRHGPPSASSTTPSYRAIADACPRERLGIWFTRGLARQRAAREDIGVEITRCRPSTAI